MPADAPVAGIIARLTEQKAHRVLFDAMARAPELSALHLLVSATASCATTCERRVEQLGLGGRVHFAGARRDLGNILAAIDMFVMPSLWEGLPLSLVLAMGAGLPVVASRVAGIPEVVQDDVSGLLVAPGDAAQLAPRWRACCRTTALRRAARRGGARVRAAALRRRRLRRVDHGALRPAAGREAASRDARHPLSHAVLAGRRRQPVGSRGIVCALRGFAGAVLRRGRALGAGVRPPQASGSRVRATNVRLAPLPYFPGPRQFYPMLPRLLSPACSRGSTQCDVIHLRVPTPAAIFAFRARDGAAQAGLPAGGRRLRGAAAAPAVSRRQEECCSAPMSRSRNGRCGT